MSTVLVVDDKQMLRDSVGVTLQRAGFTVIAAGSGDAALEIIARRRPDAVVTDLKMPGMSGVELLEEAKRLDNDLPVVLMTAYGAVETAVRAMKLGASTYITKPFEGDELVVGVKRAIEHAKLKHDNAVLRLSAPGATKTSLNGRARGEGEQLTGLSRVLGESHVMEKLREKIEAVANSHGAVLLHGESGVGKEVVARAIHELSPRSDEAMLTMNCAAMSESLLESELFGHEKGAFTGAESLRKGRFELADRGTLLLDEVSEVRPRLQAKLLRVLQELSFERVGSSTTIYVDVRIIATTNRDIESEVERGDFRQDLFYRLNVLPIHIPPLRERLEDVPTLANHFVRRVCEREGRQLKRYTAAAIELLTGYTWPGNVRELQNICERAVVLSAGETLEADLIRGWLAAPAPAVSVSLNGPAGSNGEARSSSSNGLASSVIEHLPAILGDSTRPLEEIERQAIVETLERFDGHRLKTARALGIGVRTLGLKLKKWKEAKLVAEGL